MATANPKSRFEFFKFVKERIKDSNYPNVQVGLGDYPKFCEESVYDFLELHPSDVSAKAAKKIASDVAQYCSHIRGYYLRTKRTWKSLDRFDFMKANLYTEQADSGK